MLCVPGSVLGLVQLGHSNARRVVSELCKAVVPCLLLRTFESEGWHLPGGVVVCVLIAHCWDSLLGDPTLLVSQLVAAHFMKSGVHQPLCPVCCTFDTRAGLHGSAWGGVFAAAT